jgi:hypothetical protein
VRDDPFGLDALFGTEPNLDFGWEVSTVIPESVVDKPSDTVSIMPNLESHPGEVYVFK